MMATIEATARRAGLKTLRLDTNRSLKEAQALYRKLGFEEVAAFNANPYAHHWFRKTIVTLAREGAYSTDFTRLTYPFGCPVS